MDFVQSWWGIVTNASKMRCEKFGCKRNWSWLGFCLAKFGGLAFFAFVAKLVNKWSYGFCAIMVGNCHKCIQIEVWKVWLQKKLILVGFWLSQVRWIGFFLHWQQNWWISEIIVFVQSYRELSQMHKKWGVKCLLAKGVDLGWVLA